MQKKKLAYILHDLMQGGVETALLSAIPKLAETYDLYIICIGSVDSKFINSVNNNQYQIKELRYPIWLLPWAIIKAVRYLSKIKPAIIIASLWKASITGGLYKMIKKECLLISFIHSNRFFNLPDSMGTKFAVKKSNAVFCDSKASVELIAPFVQQKPIITISFLRFPTPAKIKTKERLVPNAIFLGRLSQPKRIDKLLLLVAQCKNNNINLSVDIFGRDSDGLRSRLLARTAELNLQQQVTFKDEIPPYQVQDVLKPYDFYIQTSDNEGMAMSVVEAMQLGLVPIVTAVGEIRHYAQNMHNSIIIPLNLKGDDYLNNIAETVNNISLYNKLAQNAHHTFAGQPVYADSLISEISNLTKSSLT